MAKGKRLLPAGTRAQRLPSVTMPPFFIEVVKGIVAEYGVSFSEALRICVLGYLGNIRRLRHDVRNDLGAIDINLALLGGGPLSPEQSSAVREIRLAMERVKGMLAAPPGVTPAQ